MCGHRDEVQTGIAEKEEEEEEEEGITWRGRRRREFIYYSVIYQTLSSRVTYIQIHIIKGSHHFVSN